MLSANAQICRGLTLFVFSSGCRWQHQSPNMATIIGLVFVDMLEIIGDFKRPLVEGHIILGGKHIIMCGLLSTEDKSDVKRRYAYRPAI